MFPASEAAASSLPARSRRNRMNERSIDEIVRRSLAEDLPDITSEAIFTEGDRGRADFLVKAPGVVAGLPFAAATFQAIDRETVFEAKREDGDAVVPGDVIATVSGSVLALLSGERTALN